MRILYLAPKCYPPTGSEALTNAKLAVALLRAGVSLNILTSRLAANTRTYPQANDSTWSPLTDCIWDAPYSVGGWGARLRLFAASGHLYSRSNWACAAYRAAVPLIKSKHFDCVVSRSGPGELVGMMVSRNFGLPWLANWNDPFPAEKAPPPYGNGSGAPLRWHWRRAMKSISTQATVHTFPSERLRDYMISYLPRVSPAKTSVVPHIALEELTVKPCCPGNKVLKLVHTGDLRPPRDPGVFLQGLRQFISKHQPSVECVFMGRHSQGFSQAVFELGLGRFVKMLDEQDYQSAVALTRTADVTLLIEAPCRTGVFLPNKVVDYLQAGKPVLAISPPAGTLNDLISAYGGGLVADCDSPEAVCRGLEKLYARWESNAILEHYDPTGLLEYFSERRVVAAFMEAVRLAHVKCETAAPIAVAAPERQLA